MLFTGIKAQLFETSSKTGQSVGECCPSVPHEAVWTPERRWGWEYDTPGVRPSLTDPFLPDELFQKVAEDYVSVAAFQVMTGSCTRGFRKLPPGPWCGDEGC